MILNQLYKEFCFTCEPESQDILIAFLSRFDFESFLQEDWGVTAYIGAANAEQIDVESDFSSIPVKFSLEVKDIENKNWNAEWESNFKAIEIDKYCRIRADFHQMSKEFEHEIIINPKMSFGTGHHETTYMMIKMMENIDFKDKKVLDFGTGTGILAILAEQSNAESILAIDYDENSYNNTLENIKNNNCHNIHAKLGVLTDLPLTKYDIILANINRQVLLDNASLIFHFLNNKGILLLSGILKIDQDYIMRKYTSLGFELDYQIHKGEWLCIQFIKPSNS